MFENEFVVSDFVMFGSIVLVVNLISCLLMVLDEIVGEFVEYDVLIVEFL